jgi:hypothetical protein
MNSIGASHLLLEERIALAERNHRLRPFVAAGDEFRGRQNCFVPIHTSIAQARRHAGARALETGSCRPLRPPAERAHRFERIHQLDRDGTLGVPRLRES